MWILTISIVAFGLACLIMYLIDKNKEKLIEKFKMEKKEIMQCPSCFEEYKDLSLHFCKKCNTSLSKKTKYELPKDLKKKLHYILIGMIAVVIVGILGYVGITNLIKEYEKNRQYNEDIDYCYTAIKDKSNWEGFKIIVNNHKDESDFEQKAYENLFRAIDERIENIKNGNDDEKLVTMLGNAKTDSLNDNIKTRLEARYLQANSYTNINKANKQIEEQQYKEGYDLLSTVITSNKDKNQDIVEIATSKQNDIKEKALEQVITQAQEKMNGQDYSSAQTILSKYKDLGNQTILDMYNNATNEVNRIEAEKKAQEEAEKRKQQEEERKRQQEELNAKKDKLTINSNGKKIWKVCMTSNSFRFQATYRGSGNFIVKLLDSNQDLEEVICNEIGDYNVDKTVKVVKGSYYYVETYVSNGSWDGTWWGTYGD